MGGKGKFNAYQKSFGKGSPKGGYKGWDTSSQGEWVPPSRTDESETLPLSRVLHVPPAHVDDKPNEVAVRCLCSRLYKLGGSFGIHCSENSLQQKRSDF